MQVVKGDQNGYPVPGGIAGPPCPGGYKYDELSLHVGVGRQTDNLSPQKKLNARKPKWSRSTQKEWNRPGQWKRINEMRIAPWNARTL